MEKREKNDPRGRILAVLAGLALGASQAQAQEANRITVPKIEAVVNETEGHARVRTSAPVCTKVFPGGYSTQTVQASTSGVIRSLSAESLNGQIQITEQEYRGSQHNWRSGSWPEDQFNTQTWFREMRDQSRFTTLSTPPQQVGQQVSDIRRLIANGCR